MNPKRYNAVVDGLTSVARKVLEAVSEDHVMNAIQVYHELVKKGTPVKNYRIIEGCLGSLTNSKLLHEQTAGHWIRLPSPMIEDIGQEEASVDESTVLDHSEAFVNADAGSELQTRWRLYFPDEQMPSPAEATAMLAYIPAGDEAFTVETVETPPERDAHYEAYLIARSERTVNILRLLSEQVDDEIGLALLEIAEELDESSTLMLEYFLTMSEHIKHRLVLSPGYFQHELPDGSVIFNQVETMPPEVLTFYVENFGKGAPATKDDEPILSTEQAKERLREAGAFGEAILQHYEPHDPKRHEYLDRLMDKLKKHVSNIETPVEQSEQPPERQTAIEIVKERRTRKARCDLKIQGISQAPEHRAWGNIVARGERGEFAVQDEWQVSLKAFLRDVGYQPAPNARICRKDRDKGWFKGNAEWRLEGHPLPGRPTPPKGWPSRQHVKV